MQMKRGGVLRLHLLYITPHRPQPRWRPAISLSDSWSLATLFEYNAVIPDFISFHADAQTCLILLLFLVYVRFHTLDLALHVDAAQIHHK